MVFGFDPRKLVKDQQDEEKKKVEDVVSAQEKYDLQLERRAARLRKKSKIREALAAADKALRESKFLQKYGIEEYYKAKKKEDPEFEFPDPLGLFKDTKSPSLAEEYGDEEPIKPKLASYTSSGTTGPIETKSTKDPFANEVGQIESITHGVISGAIQIPYGFMNLGAMIMDYADKNNLPVDESRVARLDKWFEDTYAGEIMKWSSEKARQNALGKLTEVLVQMYGGWASIGKRGVAVTDDAFRMINNAIDGIKKGKYVKTSKNTNLARGVKDVKKFNNLSKKQKFTSIAVGGGLSGAVVYDAENIGTFGDLAKQFGLIEEGEWTALDRKEKSTSKEDAARMLYNKLKFAGEMGFPIIPAIWGLGKVGKSITSGVYKRAANATKFDKLVEKYVARPMRARGPYPEEQFQAMQRLKGKSDSANLLSTDFLKNIDQIVKRLSRDTQVASNATGLTDGISKAIVKVIESGKFATQKGKIVVQGFDNKAMKAFRESLEKLKIPAKEINNIIKEIEDVHGFWGQYLNTIFKGGNLNVGLKEFTKLMKERISDTLSTEYKIFKDNGLSPIDGYTVSRQIKDEVAEIFRRNYAANLPGKRMSKAEARLTVDQVIKNVQLDPHTGQPFFKYPGIGIDADKALLTKSIAKNITGGGKFVADDIGGLIQKESDLAAFQKLFGSYKNATNVISNVTADLADIAGRDRFYNVIKNAAVDQIAKGERAIVYPTYNAAAKGWVGTGEKIIDAANGLKLPNKLSEEAYTVPLDGMFTTETIAQALKSGAQNTLGSISKHWAYQMAVMAPKGLIQMGKTVGGPFTHARNFSSGAVTTVALGNIKYAITNPLVFGKALWRALNTIQPQIIWRNKPGVNYTAGAKVNANELKQGGQALYRFLLDEGMVNQNAVYRDVIGLVEDTQSLGWLKRMIEKPKSWGGKFVKAAQDMYIAEDDIWKITNFFIEDQRIHDAYKSALKKGIVRGNEIPGDLEIMKMATKKVREMLPNYAYVNEIVQSSRRSPLGNFVSWPAEIIRTSTNIMNGARAEMKSPIFKQMGWERAIGFATAVATIPPLAVWGGMKMYGITKDQLYAIKEFLPWFSKESTVIPVYEDGQYKYIDFSRAFFYDTVTNPIQAVITTMEQNKDDPVLPGLVKGMGAGLARLLEPFVSESIWLGGVADIYFRGGRTKTGSEIWNERDSEGMKFWKTVKHLARVYSPGSNIQMERLYKAIKGETIKGNQYQVTDELLGLVGLRKAPLDLHRSLEINLGKFLQIESDERKLIYADTLTGDPVTDENQIIRQYIFANQQRLETFEKLRRIYDAARTLQVSRKDIKAIFESRNRGDIYKMIVKNKFKPLSISEGMEDAYEKIDKRYGAGNPLTKRVKRRIKKLEKKLKKQRLNKEFRLLKEKEIYAPKKEKKSEMIMDKTQIAKQTPPLPPTSMPVANQAQLMAQKNPQTNLTTTEEALLSPSEKNNCGEDLMKLSKNFSLAELTKSQTAERMGLDNNPSEDQTENLRLLCERVLQPIRDHFDDVVTISSGFRTEILSRKIGSSEKSQHCRGQAADFEIFGVENNKVSDWIKENLMFDQLILEYYKPGEPNSGWIHVSYNRDVNLNRKEYLMAIKNSNGKTEYKPILGLSTDRYVK